MIDNSTASPGKMGWGVPSELEKTKVAKEKENFRILSEEAPMLVQAREAKPINQDKMAAFKDEMAKDGIDDGVCLIHLEPIVFGTFLTWLAQIIGSCVASGWMRAATRRMLAEVFILNDPEELFGSKLVGTNNVAPFAPYNYRAGRSLANMNSGDGSYCSVHIRGAEKDGILPCSAPGLVSDTFPEPQNASLYRKYGNSDAILNQFRDIGQTYKLVESVPITDGDIAIEQMNGLKPFMICSMFAFEPDYKHPTWKLRDGSPVYIYKRNTRTSWAHNMTIIGIVKVGNNWYVIVENSWGMTAHRNGSWFAIPFDLFAESWLRSAESASIGEIDMKDNPAPIG